MVALITCGHTRAGLATTRSLGRSNIAVAVGAPTRPALAMWSRFATSTFELPDPAAHPRQFAAVVAEEVRGRNAIAVFAASDSAVWALSRWRDDLPASAQVLLAPHDAIARVVERTALHDLATSIGVDCVKSFRISQESDVEPTLREAQRARFPMSVRPSRSWTEREDGTRRPNEPIQVRTIAELRRLLYEREDLIDAGVFIEPANAGRSLAYAALYDDGRPVAEIFQERLREQDSLSGVSTLAETIAPDGELARQARRVLEALNWQGPAMCEFVRSPGGTLRLRRIIGRLWNSLQLSIAAGVDIPGLAYRLCDGDKIRRLHVAAPGYRMRWVIGDAQGAIGLARGALGPKSVVDRMRELATIVDPRQIAGVDTAVFDRDDPMPFVHEMQSWASSLV